MDVCTYNEYILIYHGRTTFPASMGLAHAHTNNNTCNNIIVYIATYSKCTATPTFYCSLYSKFTNFSTFTVHIATP